MAGRGRALLLGMLVLGLAVPGAAHAATIKVTTTADERDAVPDATCSLREAVESTSQNVPFGGCKAGDTVAMDTIKLADADYQLTIPATDEAGNMNGDLDMGGGGGPLTILGKDMNGTDLFTNLSDRVIEVLAGGDLTLSTLSIGGGDVTSFGTGTGRGGNVELSQGGDLTLDRVRMSNGDAFTGGGVYLATSGTLKATRSIFSANHTTGLGGAMDVVDDATAKLKRVTVSDNSASVGPDDALGGGISSRGAKMTIKDSSIIDNHALAPAMNAATGGGIHNGSGAELVLRRSLVAGNSAATPTNNVFEGAGGIFIGAGAGTPVTIVNTTFYDNAAGAPDGIGGAVYANSGNVTITNVTFNANTAGDEGQDIYSQQATAGIGVRNSILEGSDPCDGNFNTSGGYNLAQVADPDCGFIGTDDAAVAAYGFKTGLPADNGGLTDTIALKKSSPARDLLPKARCADSKGEDQRGYTRPGRGSKRCDAGAFEFRAKP